MSRKPRRRKRGRPPIENKLEKKNVGITLETGLIKFMKDEDLTMTVSQVATEAIITQILYICKFNLNLARISQNVSEMAKWRAKLFRFDNYLEYRAQILASQGEKSNLKAMHDLSRYMLLKDKVMEIMI